MAILFSWVIPHKAAVVTHNSLSPFPTIRISQSISPFVSVSPSPEQPQNLFLYPGATETDNPDGSKTLTSTDDPNQITKWYKDQISASDMHATSISQTNSNNNILNVLAGSSNQQELTVTIEHPANQQVTTIVLRLTSK
ncbi:MAG: hypothetical protein KGJ07_08730 [Patescibacteria group bacterium]|nr:hypothetical protein [Patescibacteria group bacterium]